MKKIMAIMVVSIFCAYVPCKSFADDSTSTTVTDVSKDLPSVTNPDDIVVDKGNIEDQVSDAQALQLLWKSIGASKGASIMGIAFLIVQFLMLMFKTKLAAFAGKWRLFIVSILTVATSVIGLMIFAHLDVWSALLHSSTLAAVSVFANQAKKQFIDKVD